MLRATGMASLLLAVALAGCVGDADDMQMADKKPPSWLGDAVVVAVVDFGFNPYHVEWDAKNHPSNLDGDAATSFAFDHPPHEYLSGFPEPSAFAGYEALHTTRAERLDQESYELRMRDQKAWDGFRASEAGNVSYYWLPGTKLIGMVSFSERTDPAPVANSTAHGSRVASVSAGSLYGSCPECLLVFVEHGPGALAWANSQPWIDVVTNSYGSSGAVARTPAGDIEPSLQAPADDVWLRTHVYAGNDTLLTREATKRGQTTVFSAGNGARNSYNVPTTPFTSSQRGPDWILRVGAVYHDTGSAPTGVGKPVDVASLGTNYPSQGHPTVAASGVMSGTSNAAPVTAGMVARVLFEARLAMEGPSRAQEDGVVAVGALECGAKAPDCALGGGRLTRADLLGAYLGSATHLGEGWHPRATSACSPSPLPRQCVWPGVPAAHAEITFMSEGHGTFWGRYHGKEAWMDEVGTVMDRLRGDAKPMERPAGEAEWFQAVSYCNQQFWGEWEGGAWAPGEALPGPDPLWPTRTAFIEGCEEASLAFHAYLEAADAG